MVVLGVFLEDILSSRDGLVPFLLLDRLVDGLEQGLGARHGSSSSRRITGRKIATIILRFSTSQTFQVVLSELKLEVGHAVSRALFDVFAIRTAQQSFEERRPGSCQICEMAKPSSLEEIRLCGCPQISGLQLAGSERLKRVRRVLTG